jgi:hypothetical protein
MPAAWRPVLSDYAQIVVDTEVSAERAPELANIVRAWLVGKHIIEQEESNSVLSGTGHRPGMNYRAAIRIDADGRARLQRLLGAATVSPAWRAALVEAIEGPACEESFLGLMVNGVEFAVGRRVFDAGGNGIELGCDACGVSFEPDHSWSDAVGAWFGGDDLVRFPCTSCRKQVLLTEWRGPWPWGFGKLGIAFWNWQPLSDDFIHAITLKLGHRTVMVRHHL